MAKSQCSTKKKIENICKRSGEKSKACQKVKRNKCK